LETGKPSTFSIAARRSIFDEVGGVADHFTRYGSTQWELCTPETYNKLIELFDLRKWDGFREYEDLRREYEDLRREYEDLRYVHNLDANHNNVWKSRERNNGRLHVCQKPIDITERIINTSSKEGAVVLDLFMGSGTTGVACANTGRRFIGIERDEQYFLMAKERIEEAGRTLYNCAFS
jgi:DNA modification methylase